MDDIRMGKILDEMLDMGVESILLYAGGAKEDEITAEIEFINAQGQIEDVKMEMVALKDIL